MEKEYIIIVIVSEKINENETKEIKRFAEDYKVIKEYNNNNNGESIIDNMVGKIIDKLE